MSSRSDVNSFISQYPDTGCPDSSFGINFPSCLECPLEQGCKYDHPPNYKTKRRRNNERALLVELNYNYSGVSSAQVHAAASKIGITPRTVYNILKKLKTGEITLEEHDILDSPI